MIRLYKPPLLGGERGRKKGKEKKRERGEKEKRRESRAIGEKKIREMKRRDKGSREKTQRTWVHLFDCESLHRNEDTERKKGAGKQKNREKDRREKYR